MNRSATRIRMGRWHKHTHTGACSTTWSKTHRDASDAPIPAVSLSIAMTVGQNFVGEPLFYARGMHDVRIKCAPRSDAR